jgi:hypothetical protein
MWRNSYVVQGSIHLFITVVVGWDDDLEYERCLLFVVGFIIIIIIMLFFIILHMRNILVSY